MLAGGVGAAGLLASGGLKSAWAGQDAAKPSLVDRSREAPTAPVAVQRCPSYDPQVLRRALDDALKLIGGIGTLVNGKTVTVKLNLTGGQAGKLGGLPPFQTYHVHPNMVAAVCAVLVDAGARRIMIVEGQYSRKTPEEVLAAGGWDVAAIHAAGAQRVEFLDTRNRARFPAYSRLAVPWGGFLFPSFEVNQAYDKTDVYVSLAKLKDHACAGVTMACKNNFGIAPTALYGGDAPNENTTDYRGEILHFGRKKVPAGVPAPHDQDVAVGDWARRVPRVTADTVGARPIDLSVIDAVETNRGGEGPWIPGVEAIRPKLVLVGRNPVSTDAVCAAVMGYDPQADHFAFPFQGENHLKLLASVGVGTNDLSRIEVRGLALQEALCPFNPKRLPVRAPTSGIGYCRLHHV
jgi:uncharacterized protein (DUF362 family)